MKLACGILIAASITLSMILMLTGDYAVERYPLSKIGYANRGIFALWGIATGMAVYLNMKLLASRLQFKNRIFESLLVVGCLMTLVTVTIMGYGRIERPIHVASAMGFGIFNIVCVMWLMILKARRKNKSLTAVYITLIMICAVIFIFTSAQMGWFTALTQVLVINVCLVIMFISNFIERWPDNEVVDISEEDAYTHNKT